MIKKPGEIDRSSSTLSRNTRRNSLVHPDDEIRRLQKVPANKKCADCSAKFPQAVDLTHGTFVCLSCAGIHREFNHRIKGIGHSSFTSEEAVFVAAHGNEEVNHAYMAKYNATVDRMAPPDGSNNTVDVQIMRVWLKRKYIDKAWYQIKGQADEVRSDNDRTSEIPISKATIAKLPPKSTINTCSALIQPWDNSLRRTENDSTVKSPPVDFFEPAWPDEPKHSSVSLLCELNSHPSDDTNKTFETVSDTVATGNTPQNFYSQDLFANVDIKSFDNVMENAQSPSNNKHTSLEATLGEMESKFSGNTHICASNFVLGSLQKQDDLFPGNVVNTAPAAVLNQPCSRSQAQNYQSWGGNLMGNAHARSACNDVKPQSNSSVDNIIQSLVSDSNTLAPKKSSSASVTSCKIDEEPLAAELQHIVALLRKCNKEQLKDVRHLIDGFLQQQSSSQNNMLQHNKGQGGYGNPFDF